MTTQPSLTLRQERVAHEYVLDGNARQAAIRAGYKEAGAHTASNRLLKNRTLVALVEKLQADALAEINIGIKEIYAALWKNHKTAEANGEIHNSNRALELCGKANAMFVDKVQSTVTEYEQMSESELDAAIEAKQREIEASH